MLPITRATVDEFCRSCLQQLNYTNADFEPMHDLQLDMDLQKWFHATTTTETPRLMIFNEKNGISKQAETYDLQNYPQRICHSCYTKASIFNEFQEKSMCAAVVLKEIYTDKPVDDEGLAKLKMFCASCLRNLRSSYRAKNAGNTHNALENKQINDWLYDCTGVNVQAEPREEYAPTHICNICYKKLRNFVEYRRVAHESAEYLENVLGKVDENDGGDVGSSGSSNLITEKQNNLNENHNDNTNEDDNDDAGVVTFDTDVEADVEVNIEVSIPKTEVCVSPIMVVNTDWKVLDSEVEEKFKVDPLDECNNDFECALLTAVDVLVKEEVLEPEILLEQYEKENIVIEDDVNEKSKKKAQHKSEVFVKETVSKKFENYEKEDQLKDNLEPKQLRQQKLKNRPKRTNANYKDFSDNESIPSSDAADDDWHNDSDNSESEKSLLRSPPLTKRVKSVKTKIASTSTPTPKNKTSKGTGNNGKKVSPKCKLIRCEQCSKKFRKQYMYDAHVRGVHEGSDKPFRCEMCPQSFRSYNNMRRHFIDAHEHAALLAESDDVAEVDPNAPKTVKWSCTVCSAAFETKGFLSDHMLKSHNEVRPYKCDFCLRAFRRKDHMADHVNAVHHGIRAFKCGFCDKTFAARKTMRVHEMGHTGERPYTCEICQKTFRQPSDLKIHMEKHTTDPALLCPICYRAKSNAAELQAHIEQHNSNGYQCTKCGKTFRKLSHLNEHDQAVHLRLRPFKCAYCDQCFGARKTRRNHELIHTAEWPVKCPICGKGFRANTCLHKHMRLHKTTCGKGEKAIRSRKSTKIAPLIDS